MGSLTDKLKMLGYEETKEEYIRVYAKASKMVIIHNNGSTAELMTKKDSAIFKTETLKLENEIMLKVKSSNGEVLASYADKTERNYEINFYANKDQLFLGTYQCKINEYNIQIGQETCKDRNKYSCKITITNDNGIKLVRKTLTTMSGYESLLDNNGVRERFKDSHIVGRNIEISLAVNKLSNTHLLWLNNQITCLENGQTVIFDKESITMGQVHVLENIKTSEIYVFSCAIVFNTPGINMSNKDRIEVAYYCNGVLRLAGSEPINVREVCFNKVSNTVLSFNKKAYL